MVCFFESERENGEVATRDREDERDVVKNKCHRGRGIIVSATEMNYT